MASNPEQFITENGIKYVLAQFVDIHGVAKTKSVPAHCLMDVVCCARGRRLAPIRYDCCIYHNCCRYCPFCCGGSGFSYC